MTYAGQAQAEQAMREKFLAARRPSSTWRLIMRLANERALDKYRDEWFRQVARSRRPCDAS